jgi:hypothetical protein
MAKPRHHPDRSAAFAQVCDAGVHCATCRDLAASAWRASLCAALPCPAGAPDFACPRGKPWGWRPDAARTSDGSQREASGSSAVAGEGAPQSAASAGEAIAPELPAPDTAAAALAGVLTADLLPARLAICHSCDEFNGATCEQQFPRGCCLSSWQAWLAAKTSRCPHADGPKWPRHLRASEADPELVRGEEGVFRRDRRGPELPRETDHQRGPRLPHPRSRRNRPPSRPGTPA